MKWSNPNPMSDKEREKMLTDMKRWRERQHEAAVRSERRKRRTRNDGPWRLRCLEAYGPRCVVCGDVNVEIDHIIPLSQGGKSVVENGLVLCGCWSATVDGGHHGMKTAGVLKIRPEWLTDTQILYLARMGWVIWDVYGEPRGLGWKHFAPKTTTRPPGLD